MFRPLFLLHTRDRERIKKEEEGSKLVRARQHVSAFVVSLVAHGGKHLFFCHI